MQPEAAARAALVTVGLPPDLPVEPTKGATGALWRVRAGSRDYALRVLVPGQTVDGELAAMQTARAGGLPVPDVIARSPTAVLLAWLPGETILERLLAEPGRAAELGRLAGAAHARLHERRAPDGLGPAERWPPAAAPEVANDVPSGDTLLHLDWHPANLLVADGAITAIVDWTNARRGHPLLDLARTYTLLTVEPTLASLPEPARLAAARFRNAWAAGYGPAAAAIPPACLAWAGRAMLADLGPRYADAPERLDGVRAWLVTLRGSDGS